MQKKIITDAKKYGSWFSFLDKKFEQKKLKEVKLNLLSIRLDEADFFKTTMQRNLIGMLDEIDTPINRYWLKRLTKPGKDFTIPTTGKSYAFKRFTGLRIMSKGQKDVYYRLNSVCIGYPRNGWTDNTTEKRFILSKAERVA